MTNQETLNLAARAMAGLPVKLDHNSERARWAACHLLLWEMSKGMKKGDQLCAAIAHYEEHRMGALNISPAEYSKRLGYAA